MKKLFIPAFIFATLSFGACNSNAKSDTNKNSDNKNEVKLEESTTKAHSTDENSESSTGLKISDYNFKDPEVKKYVEDYIAFLEDGSKAIKEKDQKKAQGIMAKAQEFANRSSEIITKLSSSPEDSKEFIKFSQDVAPKIQELLQPASVK